MNASEVRNKTYIQFKSGQFVYIVMIILSIVMSIVGVMINERLIVFSCIWFLVGMIAHSLTMAVFETTKLSK